MAGAAEMALTTQLSAKDEVRALLDRLPGSVTLEDIACHLDVAIRWLEAEASDRRDDISDEEFVKHFEDKWRTA